VRACHDCSEGGLAVAAAEMALAGRRGLELDLETIPTRGLVDRDDHMVFSESLSRFIVEVAPKNVPAFERCLGDLPRACAGLVRDDQAIVLRGRGGELAVETTVGDAEQAWRGHVTNSP
jgi:phosphoribosylformylglycinamidine synthase